MKALIIGFGSIAKKHLTAIRQLVPDCEVYALRSSRDSAAHEGLINIYAWSEVPADLDFIIISNPTALHAEAIEKSIGFGVPLFIEKPVLDSLASSSSLSEELNRRNIKTYVACNLRFHPCLQFLKKEQYDLSEINEVNIYAGSYLPDWRPGQDYRKVYSANREMGGGVHLDLIHEIDYCIWLLGLPEQSSSITRSVSTLGISAIDYAHYSLQYQNFSASITLNYYRRDYKRQMEWVMAEGTLTVDIAACTVHFNGDLIFEDPAFGGQDTYRYQMKYFLDNLELDEPYMNSFDEAWEVLNICLT